MTPTRLRLCLWMIVFAVSPTVFAQHAGDLWVGRTAAGQLKIDTVCNSSCGFDPDGAVTVLTPDEFGGYSLDAPGFDRITVNQPLDEDLYTLVSGAQVYLQIVGSVPDPTLAQLEISPALLIYDPVTFYFYPYEESGTLHREIALGNYQLHKHVIWFLDPQDPAYDPQQCVWTLTARLIDKGSTSYSPSEPFTLRFALHTPVPGDFDCDQDVDATDLLLLEACHSGPAIPLAAGCEKFDLDGDGDADSADFGIFQRCTSGDGVPGDPTCAE